MSVELEIERVELVGIWRYEASNSVCGICKNELTQLCIECQVRLRGKCVPKRGVCGHAFHEHCMRKYINEHGMHCPIDTTNWNDDVSDMTANTRVKKLKKRRDI